MTELSEPLVNYRGTLYVVGPTADRVLFALDRMAGMATINRFVAMHAGVGEHAARNCLYSLMERGLVDRHNEHRIKGGDGRILTEWCLTSRGIDVVDAIRKHQTVLR